jgi:hypothetical protein
MPTATQTHTTPTRRSALAFSTAAIVAGLTVPAIAGSTPIPGARLTPIAALQKRLSDLSERRDAMDETLVRMAAGPEYDTLQEAFDQSLYDCLALQDEIATLPAENLEDAAIQVTIGYYRADLLDDRMTEEHAARLSKELRFLLASVLLAIVKAAGLDIDRLGWGEMRNLCAVHGPQRSAAA